MLLQDKTRQDKTRHEGVNEIPYLRWIFSRTDSFASTKKILVTKAYRVMYDVLKKGRVHNLSM